MHGTWTTTGGGSSGGREDEDGHDDQGHRSSAAALPQPSASVLSAAPQSVAALPAPAQSAGVPKELHLHLHAADAATVTAILRQVSGEGPGAQVMAKSGEPSG